MLIVFLFMLFSLFLLCFHSLPSIFSLGCILSSYVLRVRLSNSRLFASCFSFVRGLFPLVSWCRLQLCSPPISTSLIISCIYYLSLPLSLVVLSMKLYVTFLVVCGVCPDSPFSLFGLFSGLLVLKTCFSFGYTEFSHCHFQEMLKGAFSCLIRASDSGHTVVIKQ